MFKRALNEGLRFGCTGCSRCCSGSPGYVWLSVADIDTLALGSSLGPDEFLGRFCRKIRVGEGFGYSLKEDVDHSCIMLKEGKCSVYPSRPVQCRTYPFWDPILETETSWKEESAYCPGINRGELQDPEKIASQMLEARKNSREACGGRVDDRRKDAH